MESSKEDIAALIKKEAKFYPDFPKPGVTFMDLFSLTSKPDLFEKLNQASAKVLKEEAGEFNVIVGLESRGFIQGPILA